MKPTHNVAGAWGFIGLGPHNGFANYSLKDCQLRAVSTGYQDQRSYSQTIGWTNYAQIRWEAGDVSGGCDGLWTGYDCYGTPFPESSSARAGYASGYPTFEAFEFNGSAVAGGLLDTNLVTGLINTNFNSSVLGRYVFQFRNGVPLGHP